MNKKEFLAMMKLLGAMQTDCGEEGILWVVGDEDRPDTDSVWYRLNFGHLEESSYVTDGTNPNYPYSPWKRVK